MLIGNGLVTAGFVLCFYTLRENSFASSVIEVSQEQTVVSTGPYGRVRHPLYSAALVILFGSPIALQSRWAAVLTVLLAAVIVVRLIDEERYLNTHLEGCRAYCDTVRWRLVPGLW
ncbi:hypothetical protein WS67_09465 [Burkholderia singularis]|uniref:Isoprenylcysteine carboxyl methyltransferase n=1 Tax=Burkholderia singularis TaxID=1503053 RepID=A0A103E4I9_9BURK|nr:isoprenylcysteine carboxylmethyltransferase family protein [Burkholderia singularis]KVE28220.1 hypothetical protein WS67_09465 [Burkholderia singularis]